MRRLLRVVLAAVLLLLLLAVCIAAVTPIPGDESVEPEAYGAGAAGAIRESITGLQRTFPEINAPADNPSSDEKIALGRLLFFDPILSGNNQLACASCHHPDKGFADDQPLSEGAAGRLSRHTPALWNVAFAETLFWDGRESSLEAQALTAITGADEMGGDPEQIVTQLRAIPAYVTQFERAFGGEDGDVVTMAHVSQAIAAFERTLISQNSPFDRYAAGESEALTAAQRRGLSLFRSAATRCFECHAAPTFDSETFRVIGVADDDPGRAAVDSRTPAGAFSVPTLRNVALTAPYMHDGSMATLEEVVDFYAAGGGRVNNVENMDGFVLGFELTTQERQDLIAFLYALTDEAAIPSMPQAVPSGLPPVSAATNEARQQVAEINRVDSMGRSSQPEPSGSQLLRVERGENIQDVVDQARPGATIMVAPGVYNQQVVVDANNIKLVGEVDASGAWPVLDGGGEMADGVIASGNAFEMGYFEVRHYRSNGILVEGVSDVHLHDLLVVDTGTYGVYPTQCSGVLIERVTALQMHDAGIYAGKSQDVIIRDSVAYENVLGIEVENTVNAELYGNHVYDNATGMLIDLLPNLPSKVSINTRVYDNLIEDNNGANFAPPNIVAALVPSGVGLLLLAADEVDVIGNVIRDNDTGGLGIFSLYAAFDENQVDVGPRPENNWIANNLFENNGANPDPLLAEMGLPGADILWDVSGGGNRFDQPEASRFPPVLPGARWPKAVERIYWHGLNVLIRLMG